MYIFCADVQQQLLCFIWQRYMYTMYLWFCEIHILQNLLIGGIYIFKNILYLQMVCFNKSTQSTDLWQDSWLPSYWPDSQLGESAIWWCSFATKYPQPVIIFQALGECKPQPRPDRDLDHHQNLITSSIYHPGPSIKFHCISFITFGVMLLTDRQTSKRY